MDEPVFDEAIRTSIDGDECDLVIHRSAAGGLIAWHSPVSLIVNCSICASGERIYVR